MSHVSFAFRRRAAAIGALLALSVGLLAVARGFAESPFAILLAFFALLAAIGFGWVALTARGEQRNRAAWVAVGLLAIAFIAAVGGTARVGRWSLGVRNRKFAAPWAGTRWVWIGVPGPRSNPGHPGRCSTQTGPADQSPVRGRQGQAPRSHGDRHRQGIECHRFGPGADLGDLTRAALAKGADVVGVAGGDGSLGVVADLVSGAGVQMVCIPAGTRNHFAMDLGLDRGDPVAALDAFGPARLQTVDIARVNGTAFLNNVSMGIYGGVVQSANYRERKLETTIDALPTLVENPPDLRFIGPDGLPHTTVHVVHVSNNPYLMELRGAGGRPRLDTGKLGIVTVELSSPAGVTDMLARAALGLLNTSPDFSAWTGTRFEVDSDRPIAAGVDGEAEGSTRQQCSRSNPGHCRCGFRSRPWDARQPRSCHRYGRPWRNCCDEHFSLSIIGDHCTTGDLLEYPPRRCASMREMSNPTDLSTRSLIQAGIPALIGSVAIVAGIIWFYMVLPVPEAEDSPWQIVLGIGVVSLIYLSAGVWAMLRINRSRHPLSIGILALSVMVTAMIVTFAMVYVTMSSGNPSNFNVPLEKISALYFTMTILSTTGFGDITASSDAAMIAVMAQMVVGLTRLYDLGEGACRSCPIGSQAQARARRAELTIPRRRRPHRRET